MKRITTTFFALITAIGCSEADFGDKKEQNNPEVEAQPLAAAAFTNTVYPTATPNKYAVSIEWPSSSDQVEISFDGKILKRTVPFENKFEEILEGGRSYAFQLSAYSTKGVRFRTQYQVNVPLDVVLSGKIEFKGHKKIKANRLFIRKDAEIYSYKNNLEIDVIEIISEGGKLQNYPWGYLDCPYGQRQGHTGGNIHIKAKRASGDLAVTMVGSQGCPPICSFGGAGGDLKVQIEDGGRLNINTQLLQALGSQNNIGRDCYDRVGAQATSCISLDGGSGENCFSR